MQQSDELKAAIAYNEKARDVELFLNQRGPFIDWIVRDVTEWDVIMTPTLLEQLYCRGYVQVEGRELSFEYHINIKDLDDMPLEVVLNHVLLQATSEVTKALGEGMDK